LPAEFQIGKQREKANKKKIMKKRMQYHRINNWLCIRPSQYVTVIRAVDNNESSE